jgi:hypothetical protein
MPWCQPRTDDGLNGAMSEEADRFAFEQACQRQQRRIRRDRKMAATVDTPDGFLREMKTRFPDMTARAPLAPETVRGDPVSPGSLPEIVGLMRRMANSTVLKCSKRARIFAQHVPRTSTTDEQTPRPWGASSVTRLLD